MLPAPSNVSFISLREVAVGGAVRKHARVVPPDLFKKTDRLLLLVHGFNVAETAAKDSYSDFEANLSEEVGARVVRVLWPGDARWFSKFSYPKQPRRARRSAQRIVELLAEAFAGRAEKAAPLQPPKLEIAVVAHSLGCRLTLELLERVWIASKSLVRIPLVVLMAAAVPRYSVRRGGDFDIMMANIPRVWVLRSTEDKTLRRFFRAGQLLERPFGSFWRLTLRGALGRGGMKPQSNISVLRGTWDHSDYWGDRDIADAVDDELLGRRRYTRPYRALKRKLRLRKAEIRRLEARRLEA